MAVFAVTLFGERELSPDYGDTQEAVAARLAELAAEHASLTGSATPQAAVGELWLKTRRGGMIRYSDIRELKSVEQ